MAPSAVRFHPAAAQEVESTYAWYAAGDVAAARGFREELRQAVDASLRARRLGRATGAAPGATCFLATPSVSSNIVRGEALEIVAVAHGRRRPGYWRSRLRNAV